MITGRFPAPRPFTADQACDDFIEFIALAAHDAGAEALLRKLFATKTPVICCKVLGRDADGKKRAQFDFVPELKEYLTAHKELTH